MPFAVVVALMAVSTVLALFIAVRVGVTQSREGKVLAFIALAVLPLMATYGGFEEHLERATSTRFCLSCHVMKDFGRTLEYDDRGYIPAVHYQNNFVPRDQACYTCHTDYAMFGGVQAKIHGVRHLLVQYLGTIPQSADVKLYEPFPNQTCLHCHLGARRFEEVNGHHKAPDTLPKMKAGSISCISGGCHDTVHEIGDLKNATFRKQLTQ